MCCGEPNSLHPPHQYPHPGASRYLNTWSSATQTTTATQPSAQREILTPSLSQQAAPGVGALPAVSDIFHPLQLRLFVLFRALGHGRSSISEPGGGGNIKVGLEPRSSTVTISFLVCAL